MAYYKKNNALLMVSAIFIVPPVIYATPAVAQATEDAASSASPAEGEIVVTAQKREQNLQDVGLSVTALGSQLLEDRRVSALSDLAAVVPGLTFTQSTSNTPVYTLRGVGFFESSLAAYPDVATYIDQFALPLPITATLTAFDLERVEVLKGPQGTLFGNNATGGAINFIAAKPRSSFGAGAEVSYGRFNTLTVDAFVTGPLTNGINARLAVRAENGDEWQKSYTGNDKLGRSDNIAGRFVLDIRPSERLTINVNINGWRNQDDPQAPQFFKRAAQNAPGAAGVFGTVPPDLPIFTYPLAPKKARAADFGAGGRPYSDNEFWQAAVRADYELNDVITLSSLSSYLKTSIDERLDTDGVRLEVADLAERVGKIKSFSQELRSGMNLADRMRLLVGANYEKTSVYESNLFLSGDSTSGIINGFSLATYDADQDMENYALFGNAEFEVNDRLTLKGGARYTQADRTTSSRNREDPRFTDPIAPGVTGFFNVVWGSLGFIYPNYQPIQRGDSFIIDNRLGPDGLPLNPATYGTAGTFVGKLKENNLSWSVGADYDLTDDILIYANLSKGYKAGSFPATAGATFSQYEAIKQESLLSYEAGLKSQFLDRAITLNAAGFYYDYRNKQLKSKVVDGIFGLLDALVNVPRSRIFGAELEAVVIPTDGLTLTGAVTYLNTKVKKYDGTVGSAVDPNTGLRVPVTQSFAGADLPFSPKWQYSTSARYERGVADALRGYVAVDVSGQSNSSTILSVTPGDLKDYAIGSRFLVGGSVGLKSEAGWSASFWGRNIFNKYYVTSAQLSYDNIVRYAGRPAEYGVTVGFNF